MTGSVVAAGNAGLQSGISGPDANGTVIERRLRRSLWSPTTAMLSAETFASAFTSDDPLLRHVRTRVRSPEPNGVVERLFGTLKYEHLYRTEIADGDGLAVEVHRFHQSYTPVRPHQALRIARPSPPTVVVPPDPARSCQARGGFAG